MACKMLELTIIYGGRILEKIGILKDFITVHRVLNDSTAPDLNYQRDMQSEEGKSFRFEDYQVTMQG